MDNRVAIMMFIAMLVYLVFCLLKTRKFYSCHSEQNSRNEAAFGAVMAGMLSGFLAGVFFSPSITRLVLSKDFIRKYSNPDIGEASFHIIATFILTVSFGIISLLIPNLLSNLCSRIAKHRGSRKNKEDNKMVF